ncbi:MAG: hypothetical protein ACJ8AD_14445 [Gemmatimonadaceae bacterium]
MRAHTSFYSLLAAAALSATAAASATAQQSATPGFVRLVATTATSADAPRAVRTLATYDFNSSVFGMPSRVTVVDSAGTLVATFRARGDNADQPMRVAVTDRDVLLEGETVRGRLKIRLYDQNDRVSAGAVIGNWELGSLQGELRARAVR